MDGNEKCIMIARQPADWQTMKVSLNDLEGIHWDNITGGIQIRTTHECIMAYTRSEEIIKNVACSGMHDYSVNGIKVCIIKKYTKPEVYKELMRIAGHKKLNTCEYIIMRLLMKADEKCMTRKELKEMVEKEYKTSTFSNAINVLEITGRIGTEGSSRSSGQKIFVKE